MLSERTFTLRLADGSTVTGPVHGSGGVIGKGEKNRERLAREIKRANDGQPLGIYEPKPGHARMYLNYSAQDSGEPIDIDLRGAELVEDGATC